MLWADTRVMRAGPALVLLLGNSGPSIARKVKVIFDPAPLISACLTRQRPSRHRVSGGPRRRTQHVRVPRPPATARR
jgi:hypothetical protein